MPRPCRAKACANETSEDRSDGIEFINLSMPNAADGGRAGINVGEEGGLNRLGGLSCRQRGEIGHRNPGVLRQSDLFGFLKRQVARLIRSTQKACNAEKESET